MIKLKIINSTVRPGRKGPAIQKWISEVAAQHGEFEVEVLDLAVINLPLMNEPNHPAQRKYEHEYTKKWSATIDEADAFIFVTGEYDHNYPAPLRNAIEYLYHEWNYKAAGIVSYGGVSAGTRAFVGLKSDLSSIKVVPVMEAVHIPFFTQHINDEEEFIPSEMAEKTADVMLKELVRWTKGLKLVRENKF
jgi:NAD(P)H-dependent FMN reductase